MASGGGPVTLGACYADKLDVHSGGRRLLQVNLHRVWASWLACSVPASGGPTEQTGWIALWCVLVVVSKPSLRAVTQFGPHCWHGTWQIVHPQLALDFFPASCRRRPCAHHQH